MLRSDANIRGSSAFNTDLISIDIIPLIEKDIDQCDLISLVFLLYDVPDTALQRLTVYQRISKDIGYESNLLLDWAHAQTQPNWKGELLEALYTCQLYSVIRKIGLSVDAVRRFHDNNNSTLINPMKKVLYRLCEHMNNENLYKLKKTLITYDIDTTDYDTCELVLLHLMCRRFITVSTNYGKKGKLDIESLAKIIDNLYGLQRFSYEMRQIEIRFNNVEKPQLELNHLLTSTPQQLSTDEKPSKINEESKPFDNFDEIFEMFNELKLENISDDNIKSDTSNLEKEKILGKDSYQIINPKSVGVCLIINQEHFHPSKQSIESMLQATPLENRTGSSLDRNNLAQTMKNLNFVVEVHDDLSHTAMLECIKSVIKYKISKDHSMFMLCILSHGTKGHVYAADSVKIKVEDIESLLDTDDALHLRNKPKILILQACQTNDNDESYIPLAADSPKAFVRHYIKKSDILRYWATAPNYESYRHITMGSIFIQMICKFIKECSKKDHVNDIFTKVNYAVHKLCVSLKRDQLPKVEHTLIKKLYLQIPEKENVT